MNAGLSLSGVTLELGDGDETVLALDDVDLTVEPGEFVAVVGPSGSGKSSLLAVAGATTRRAARCTWPARTSTGFEPVIALRCAVRRSASSSSPATCCPR